MHSREYRKELHTDDYELWKKFESWYRHDKLLEFAERYLSALNSGNVELNIKKVYRNGFDGLYEETIPVTPWSILEGVFSLSDRTVKAFSNSDYSVTSITMVINDIPLEERVRRVHERAPYWDQNPDEQQFRMEKIFEPSWQQRHSSVLKLAQWKIMTNDKNLTIVKN